MWTCIASKIFRTWIKSLASKTRWDNQAIIIVEWSERFSYRTDLPRVEISLEHAGGDGSYHCYFGPGPGEIIVMQQYAATHTIYRS